MVLADLVDFGTFGRARVEWMMMTFSLFVFFWTRTGASTTRTCCWPWRASCGPSARRKSAASGSSAASRSTPTWATPGPTSTASSCSTAASTSSRTSSNDASRSNLSFIDDDVQDGEDDSYDLLLRHRPNLGTETCGRRCPRRPTIGVWGPKRSSSWRPSRSRFLFDRPFRPEYTYCFAFRPVHPSIWGLIPFRDPTSISLPPPPPPHPKKKPHLIENWFTDQPISDQPNCIMDELFLSTNRIVRTSAPLKFGKTRLPIQLGSGGAGRE